MICVNVLPICCHAMPARHWAASGISGSGGECKHVVLVCGGEVARACHCVLSVSLLVVFCRVSVTLCSSKGHNRAGPLRSGSACCFFCLLSSLSSSFVKRYDWWGQQGRATGRMSGAQFGCFIVWHFVLSLLFNSSLLLCCLRLSLAFSLRAVGLLDWPGGQRPCQVGGGTRFMPGHPVRWGLTTATRTYKHPQVPVSDKMSGFWFLQTCLSQAPRRSLMSSPASINNLSKFIPLGMQESTSR